MTTLAKINEAQKVSSVTKERRVKICRDYSKAIKKAIIVIIVINWLSSVAME